MRLPSFIGFLLASGTNVRLDNLLHGKKSTDGLDERYATIAAAQLKQQTNYEHWLTCQGSYPASLVEAAADLGLLLHLPSGTVDYARDFDLKRPKLCFDLMYVRHGKTTGNTEPRVFQGNVDEPSNALNEVGRGQAEAAADLLDAQIASGSTPMPELVVLSPLGRAYDTGMTFIRRHPELKKTTEIWPESSEMAFGAWDNELVQDLADDSIAHLFYLRQNAVVRADSPYNPATDPRRLEDGNDSQDAPSGIVPAESFVQVLVRMNAVLRKINERMSSVDGPAPSLVLMYGHSMAGAALSILTGNGKRVEGSTDPPCLGFDGKYIMPNAQPVVLHRAKH